MPTSASHDSKSKKQPVPIRNLIMDPTLPRLHASVGHCTASPLVCLAAALHDEPQSHTIAKHFTGVTSVAIFSFRHIDDLRNEHDLVRACCVLATATTSATADTVPMLFYPYLATYAIAIMPADCAIQCSTALSNLNLEQKTAHIEYEVYYVDTEPLDLICAKIRTIYSPYVVAVRVNRHLQLFENICSACYGHVVATTVE